MKTIVLLTLDGVLDSSLTIALDTLRAAEAFRARKGRTSGLRVLVAGFRKRIRTAGGLRVPADVTFAELGRTNVRADWLLVPGLSVTSGMRIAARFEQRDALAAMDVLRQTGSARNVGATCSAVFLLAEAGLLEGRDVTTTWWLAQAFRERHPAVHLDETRMLVHDGRYLTAGSAFAQLDLVLAVITDTLGPAIAELCSRYLLIDRRPSQARYMIRSHLRHVDPTVVAAEKWIDRNLDRAVTVQDLATALAVSPKTLGRRIGTATGVSPVRFLQRRRVLHAAHLLETTSMTVDQVASSVGYQDATALRKVIRRELGVTPASMRR